MEAKRLRKIFGVSGFTLVELIVVITILTILGTIAFVQIGGFAGSARDGSRVSDMTNISKWLDIYRIRSGSYPTPSIPTGASSLTTVSYSGSTLFTQWVIGDSVIAALASMGSKMSKKPMDPLRTTTEYVYSVSTNTAEYQIKTDWEGDSVAYNNNIHPAFQAPLKRGIFSFYSPLEGWSETGVDINRGLGVDTAYAASGNPTLTYIRGNYNGIIVRTKTSPIYFLALPSIITSATGTLTHTGISGKILKHGETNSGGISYDTTVANFLVYSSGALPSTDAERILLGSGIARAYSGTSLAGKSSIKSFVDALAANNTGALASLGGGVVTSVGGSAASGGGNSGGSGGGGTTPTTPAVCGTANGSTGSTAPSTSPLSNVCSVGTLSGSVSGAGPWSWTCNSTDGGSSASCVQYSNLVNGACAGLPANAVYYWGVTSYSLVNASAGTSLVASGVSTPVVNTCQFGCNGGSVLIGGSCVVKWEQVYTTPGSYTWTVPAGVTSVSVVAIGGGAGSGGSPNGTGGGGLGYKNNIAVTPGNSYTVVVGTGGTGSNGGDSYFGSNTTDNLNAVGKGGTSVWPGGPGGVKYGDGGGNGGAGGTYQGNNSSGNGGGGSGGYSGNGGNGADDYGGNGGPGSGGGGGGGAFPKQSVGGVGIFGQGTSGTNSGGGGSGGGNGNYGGGSGGNYGGGWSGMGGIGGPGAVRIIWPGTSRTFPSNDVGP